MSSAVAVRVPPWFGIPCADLGVYQWPDPRCPAGDQPAAACTGENGSGNQCHCLAPSKAGAGFLQAAWPSW